jgi:hypothetical protein
MLGSLNEFPIRSGPYASLEIASLHSYLREAGLMTAATRARDDGAGSFLVLRAPAPVGDLAGMRHLLGCGGLHEVFGFTPT